MHERLKGWATALPSLTSRGMMSLPKSWLELGSAASARSSSDRKQGVEDIDAHAGQRPVRGARHGGRVGRLFQEFDDPVRGVHGHDPEARGLRPRRLDAGHGHIGALLDVLAQHRLEIHLVDVVAGHDDDEARFVVLDDVEILEHGVGGSEVPVDLRHPLAGWQDVERFVAFRPEEVPAALQMADQAVSLVLRRYGDAADAAVERVRQGEIDDSELAAEIDGRLGADVGQLHQPAAPATRQHIGHGLA